MVSAFVIDVRIHVMNGLLSLTQMVTAVVEVASDVVLVLDGWGLL